MRAHGTLVKWNDDRGFGFIEPAVGTEQIFVHISAFPRDGIRPCIGETVSFEIDLRGDGKKRAVRVMRPGGRGTAPRTRRPRPTASRQSPLTAVASLLLLAAIGWYGYSRLTAHRVTDSTPIPAPAAREVPYTPAAAHPTPAAPAPVAAPAVPALADTSLQPFHCDGRTYCSQMHSCAEATYFIRQCPGTRMDGNHDGVPCESQWCTGGAD
jgi:cold shock CspA family protein